MKTFGLLIAAGALANLNAESLTAYSSVNNTKAMAGASSATMAKVSLPMLKARANNSGGSNMQPKKGAMDDDTMEDASGDGTSSGSSSLDSDGEKVGEMDTSPQTPGKSSAQAVISSFGFVTACVVISSFMN
uniref:AlNc14C26G2588 protein n=1 Tax=Albugo laibachii Nc14 TaxID=890382 RepID=F0W6V2_9STRA|nr:AlNc14C26G2588 [Albugo laibachii Nc14]|eukprot:CCA16847.1 AlNc14C26G2588 [Albugo laibachii Nc14]